MHTDPSTAFPSDARGSASPRTGPSVQPPGPSIAPSPSASLSQSQSHSFQSFGEYSQFLRSAVADEESLQVGESLQALAVQIESLVAMLQQRGEERPSLALALINLVGDLRTHRAMLLALSADWHCYYEFDAHFAALNHFRILVTQWAMDAAPPRHGVPALADFDLAAWRVLGAGSLLLDVYEQARARSAVQDEERVAPTVWGRWNAWWKRRQIRRKVIRQEGRRGRRMTD